MVYNLLPISTHVQSQACHWACNTATVLYEDCLQGCQQDCNKDNIEIDLEWVKVVSTGVHIYVYALDYGHRTKSDQIEGLSIPLLTWSEILTVHFRLSTYLTGSWNFYRGGKKTHATTGN